MSDLKPHKYADIFPLLTGKEYEDLKQDIKENGLLTPIILFEDQILDGRNRYNACKDLGISFKTETYTGSSPLSHVISLNLKRRHLNESQRGIVASIISTFKWGGDRSKSPIGDLKTEYQAAKELNVSTRTIQRIKQIEREAPEKIKEIEAGKLTAHEVITELKIAKREESIKKQREAIEKGDIKLPTGFYDLIVIDPPWKYGNVDNYSPNGFFGRVANPYPEMEIQAIKDLKIPAAENCTLWLWTTHRYIFDCKEILLNWGFTPVSVLTWVKDKIGVGFYLRSQSEYCVMAIKGKPTLNLTNETTVLYAKNRGHSVKPEEFYRMVEKLCIAERKLDYFARDKKTGWDCYGAEVL